MPLTRQTASLLVDLAILVVWGIGGPEMTNWCLGGYKDFGGKTRSGLKG